MPISLTCPTCGTKLKAPDKAAGHKSQCPNCGADLLVSPAATDVALSKPVAVPLANVPITWVDKPDANSLNKPMTASEVARALAALQNSGIPATHQRREDPLNDWGGSVEWSEEWDVFIVSRADEQQAGGVILKAIGRGSIRGGDFVR